MRKILIYITVIMMVVSMGGCGNEMSGESNITETPAPTETQAPTPVPTKKPTPAIALLTDDTTEIVPQKLEVNVTSDIHMADFEDGTMPDWLFGEGEIVETDAMNGTKAVQLSGGMMSLVPPEIPDEQVVVFKFKVKVDGIPAKLEADNYFLTENELFHVRVGETGGRYTTATPYSSKFSIIKHDEKTGYFAGKTTEVNYAADFVLREPNNCRFSLVNAYDVALYFTKDRCYIEINDGANHVSYGNARQATEDLMFVVRKGVTVLLDDISYYTATLPEYEVSEMVQRFVDEGLFTNYLTTRNSIDGAEFERISHEARVKYYTASTSCYNLGLTLDMFSNTRYVSVTFKNLECYYGAAYPLAIDIALNGVREKDVMQIISRVGHDYTIAYKLPSDAPEYNRITFYFAADMAIAVKDIKIDEGAVTAPVPKDGNVIFVGDSITEGAECYYPGDVWASVVSEEYNFNMLNQAVGGWSFAECNVYGDYGDFEPEYIFIANGTNSYGGGHQSADAKRPSITSGMIDMLESIRNIFPNAKIFGITPIWRSDEEGPACTLLEVSAIIEQVYESEGITVIDGYNMVPHEMWFFSNPLLAVHVAHPGQAIYGQNMIKELETLIGAPKDHDWAAEAAAAFGK